MRPHMLALTSALALAACGSSDPTPSPAPVAAPAARPDPVAAADPPATDPPSAAAPTAPAAESAPSAPAASSARVLADCLWFADPEPPPLEGPGSMAELDDRIGASLSRPAFVVGRVRLRARGCPRLSAGVVLVAPASDAEDPIFSIVGEHPPVAGERGDERRDRPFRESGNLADDETDGVEGMSQYFFRAIHAASGAVEDVEVDELGEACTLFAHDLQHGDLDRDGTTEIRVETWASTVMDSSAGAERRAVLVIYDLAELRREITLDVGTYELAEIEGYGGRWIQSEVTFRDLDDDGDRDLVVRRRESGSFRTDDDMDEEEYRHWSNEAYAYDAPADTFRRADTLDARIPGGRPR